MPNTHVERIHNTSVWSTVKSSLHVNEESGLNSPDMNGCAGSGIAEAENMVFITPWS